MHLPSRWKFWLLTFEVRYLSWGIYQMLSYFKFCGLIFNNYFELHFDYAFYMRGSKPNRHLQVTWFRMALSIMNIQCNKVSPLIVILTVRSTSRIQMQNWVLATSSSSSHTHRLWWYSLNNAFNWLSLLLFLSWYPSVVRGKKSPLWMHPVDWL